MGSNDIKSPEPPEPNSGNTIVVVTIGVLLLTILLIALGDIIIVETNGVVLLTAALLAALVTVVRITGVLLFSMPTVALDENIAIVEVLITLSLVATAVGISVFSIRLVRIPEEVKASDVGWVSSDAKEVVGSGEILVGVSSTLVITVTAEVLIEIAIVGTGVDVT